jgi:hypothetical protein
MGEDGRSGLTLRIDNAWSQAVTEFEVYLDSVGLGGDITTTATTLWPKRISVAEAHKLVPYLRADPAIVAAFRGTSDPDVLNLFVHPAPAGRPGDFGDFLWLEPHSAATAWWLMVAWRLRQFSQGAGDALARYELLVAAACARSLLEATAALYDDARDLAEIWARCKAIAPSPDRPVPPAYSDLKEWGYGVLLAGKFATESASKQAAERVKRRNVQTSIGRLEKHGVVGITETYDWLCNAVHPSVGGTFAFAGPISHVDDAAGRRMRMLMRFAEHPLRSYPGDDLVDATITTAIRHAVGTSLTLAVVVLRDALRVIDDMGLTTGAARYAEEPYWRGIVCGGRNDPCPCGSSRTWKACIHRWEGPVSSAPDISGVTWYGA